jgi:hypothetical protein
MSDESTVMPDSSSLSPDEGDSRTGTQVTSEQGTESTTGDSPKGIQSKDGQDPVMAKRLADTETALKERQREFTEMSLKLAELKGQFNERTKSEQTTSDPMADVWNAELEERFVSEPQKVIGEVLQRQQRAFGQVLQQRDDYWKDQIGKIVDERVNPERIELRDTINELSKSDWFTKLSPNEQVAAAKQYRGAPGRETGPQPHSTSLGGTGRRTVDTRTADETRRATAKAIMENSFPMTDNSNTLEPTLSVSTRQRR